MPSLQSPLGFALVSRFPWCAPPCSWHSVSSSWEKKKVLLLCLLTVIVLLSQVPRSFYRLPEPPWHISGRLGSDCSDLFSPKAFSTVELGAPFQYACLESLRSCILFVQYTSLGGAKLVSSMLCWIEEGPWLMLSIFLTFKLPSLPLSRPLLGRSCSWHVWSLSWHFQSWEFEWWWFFLSSRCFSRFVVLLSLAFFLLFFYSWKHQLKLFGCRQHS